MNPSPPPDPAPSSQPKPKDAASDPAPAKDSAVPKVPVMDPLELRLLSVHLVRGILGAPVIPLGGKEGKAPLLVGFPDLRIEDQDDATAEEYCERGNVGMQTGKVDVLDIDPKDGETVEQVKADLGLSDVVTVEVSTPRGGRHLYFAPSPVPLGNSVKKLHPSLDVRTVGGQVVLPGSVNPKNGKAYAWLPGRAPDEVPLAPFPAHLLKEVKPKASPKKPKAPKASQPEAVPASHFDLGPLPEGVTEEDVVEQLREKAPKWLEIDARVVAGLAEDCEERNDTLNRKAFHCHGLACLGLLDADAVDEALGSAAKECGLEEKEVWLTLQSAAKAAAEKGVDPAFWSVAVYAAKAHALWRKVRVEREILQKGGELHAVVRLAEEKLIEAGELIYVRGGELVHPIRVEEDSQDDEAVRRKKGSIIIQPVSSSWLMMAMTRTADWKRITRKGEIYDADPDKKYPECLLALKDWKFPGLRGVVGTPTLRRDGSVLQVPGYDAASGLLFDPCGVKFPQVPENPTKEEGERGLFLLDSLIEKFPFVDDDHKATFYSACLSGLIRKSLRACPAHAFDSPQVASGKTKLCEIVGILMTGVAPPAVSQGATNEEDEKRMSSMLRVGDPLIMLDNVTRVVEGDFMNSLLTSEFVDVRPLCTSTMLKLPTDVLVLLNGLNVTIAADLTRRMVKCRLDAKMERPEERSFDFEPCERARARRAEIVAGLLTALRAYVVAGRPNPLPKVGSFEEWNLVRETLAWYGRGDPNKTRIVMRNEDPRREADLELLRLWHELLGSKQVTVGELGKMLESQHASVRPLRDALMSISNPKEWSAHAVSLALRQRMDKVVGNFALRQAKEKDAHAKAPRWWVEKSQ